MLTTGGTSASPRRKHKELGKSLKPREPARKRKRIWMTRQTLCQISKCPPNHSSLDYPASTCPHSLQTVQAWAVRKLQTFPILSLDSLACLPMGKCLWISRRSRRCLVVNCLHLQPDSLLCRVFLSACRLHLRVSYHRPASHLCLAWDNSHRRTTAVGCSPRSADNSPPPPAGAIPGRASRA